MNMHHAFYDPELPAGFQDADFEMRALEDAGNEHHRRIKKSAALRSSDPEAAARVCPHGGGYSVPGIAADRNNDPRANTGDVGFRCYDCGSFLSSDPWDNPTVIAPCEIDPS